MFQGKTCTRCRQEKPLDNFGKKDGKEHGFSRCKACRTETERARRKANRDAVREMFAGAGPEVEVKEVAGFPGYFIGKDGSPWSYGKKNTKGWWKRLKPQPRSKKVRHLVVTLWCREERKHCFRYVHRLVLEAFVGPCPEGMQCRHDNGNPHDNRLENLQWGTPLDNMKDKIRHGTMPRGSTHWKTKITEQDVLEIRRLCAEGRSQSSVSRMYGVSPGAIFNIVHRIQWYHI